MVPAIRATRVPPLAALRDVALDRSGASRVRIALGVVIAGHRRASTSPQRGPTAPPASIPTVGLGALLLIVGAIVIGPVLAGPEHPRDRRPATAAQGHHRASSPRENAARSPKRTSATASALVIGVALVGFITVFAASAKTSVSSEVERGFKGDFVIQSSGGGVRTTVGVPEPLSLRPPRPCRGSRSWFRSASVEPSSPIPMASAPRSSSPRSNPRASSEVLDPRMVEGSVTDLSDDGIIVDKELAEAHDVQIGDRIEMTVPGGAALDLEVQAISDDREPPRLVHDHPHPPTPASYPSCSTCRCSARSPTGASIDTVIADVDAATADAPGLEVLDRDGFIGDLASQITSFVTVIYGLLILSIIIALIGIANTLSLSINERTRELGLLRAVGHAPSPAALHRALGGGADLAARHAGGPRRSASG